eukprot:SAG22_NODE_13943_length_390_cov_0.817869_2_plen_47_part_01
MGSAAARSKVVVAARLRISIAFIQDTVVFPVLHLSWRFHPSIVPKQT